MAAPGCPIHAEPYFDKNLKRFLKITPRWQRMGGQVRSMMIPETQLWMYSEEHNPETFKGNIAVLTMQMNRFYQFGLDEKSLLAKIATEIHNGIQDTIQAKPPRRDKERVQIGEVDITVNPRTSGEQGATFKNVPLYDDQLPDSASEEEEVVEIVNSHDDDPRGRDI